MLEVIINYKLPIILVFLAVILFLETRNKLHIYVQKEKIRWRRNISLFLITGLTSALIVLPVTYWAVDVTNWRNQMDFLNHWSAIFVDMLILDFWIYLWHRANHKFDFLWRFHEIHHLDQKMDMTTALRFHFGEVILSAFCRMPVMIVFDMPMIHIILFEIVVMCSAIFHHSAIKLPPRLETYLYGIWVTPSYHLIHHHAKRQDLNSHYATMLPIWDRLCGTFQGRKKIEINNIGVPDHLGRILSDLSIFDLIKRPFQRSRD